MKKISIILIAISAIASAQLRLGLDVSRKATLTRSYSKEFKALAAASGESLPGEQDLKVDGMGISLGYDLMLLSLVGVGAELNIGSGGDSEDDHDHDDEEHSDEEIGPDNQVFVYGVAKVPVFPMVRGVIRAGLVKSFDSELDPGLGFGFGLRVKPPIFPIGLEANYTIYNFSADQDLGMGFTMSTDMKQSYLNLTATYKF